MSTGASTEPSRADEAVKEGHPKGLRAALAGLAREPLYWLLAAVPVAAVLDIVHANGLAVFLASAVAIIPLAGLLGRATESLSRALSPALGGLLNMGVFLRVGGDFLVLVVGFDPKYLTDMLRVLGPDDGLTLELIDGNSVALFRFGADYSYIAMPLS